MAVLIFAGATSLRGQSAGPEDVAVTAVAGESWIRHLHTTFNDTRMGRTWNLGPAPASAGNQAAASQLKLSPGYTAHRAVNAVPVVCDAPPGIRTTVDLPQVIARLGET